MRRYFSFITAVILFVVIHEGTHALVAYLVNEYEAFQVHFYGFEVVFKTQVADRTGIKWGFISGSSNLITLLTGYILFLFRNRLARLRSSFLNSLGYWIIFVFLLFDAINLSVIPFFFGGDIRGLEYGFGINRYLIQAAFFMLLLLNRELIIHKLFPLYRIKTKHILFQPIFKVKDE